MSYQNNASGIRVKSFFALLKQAVLGSEHQDFTSGSIRRAVVLLAIPMVLEMIMESVFALVDIYVVGKLGVTEAVTTIALTEFVLTIVYSIGIGLSMAATAMVARRVGEKDHDAAARSGMQAIYLGILVSLVITIIGAVFPADILRLMGATEETVRIGTPYTRIVFASNVVVMLLFLINGIFRGSGDAAMAMRSLWLANICNIILCPLLVLYGIGPIPALGITGAALATSIGRGIGVLYQLYHLFGSKRIIKIRRAHVAPDWKLIRAIFKLGWTATLQFIIASASWMVLGRIMAAFGPAAVAGYGLSIRLIMFFLLPAWGISNAAATLVGQNLGARQPDRAERSVWTTAKYNTVFMIFVTLIFLFMATPIVEFMNKDAHVVRYAVQALQIMSLGYIFYGVGMVVTNAFNGAGDTKTPTLINLFGFWLFQIPLAGALALLLDMGPKGVFIAVLVSETAITIAGVILFRRGAWKTVQI